MAYLITALTEFPTTLKAGLVDKTNVYVVIQDEIYLISGNDNLLED